MNPLSKPQIRRWVAALRSGEYKQGQHRLCKDESDPFDGQPSDEQPPLLHCCLGVACDLFFDGYWHRAVAMTGGDTWCIRKNDCMPPKSLQKAINAALPGLQDPDDAGSPCDILARANDDGKTFKRIARMIERAAGL